MSRNTQRYRRFWNQLLDRPAADTTLHEAAFPRADYHMAASAGVDRISFVYVIKSWAAAVELSRRGSPKERPDQLQYSFKRLKQNKTKIENALGEKLEWIPTGNTLVWRIVASLDDVGGLRHPPKEWPATHDAMIAAMARLEDAVSPYLDDIAAKLPKLSPEDKVPTFDAPYRPPKRGSKKKETEPFAVDPNVVDRGKQSHRNLQEKLRKLAEARGLKTRSPGGPDPDFDVGWWRSRTTFVVVECKSTTDANEERQLRLGLGQILDYAYRGRRATARIVPVLAVERRPRSDRWLALCASYGVTLVWPGSFQTLFP